MKKQEKIEDIINFKEEQGIIRSSIIKTFKKMQRHTRKMAKLIGYIHFGNQEVQVLSNKMNILEEEYDRMKDSLVHMEERMLQNQISKNKARLKQIKEKKKDATRRT